jgi:hypothetical protein
VVDAWKTWLDRADAPECLMHSGFRRNPDSCARDRETFADGANDLVALRQDVGDLGFGGKAIQSQVV